MFKQIFTKLFFSIILILCTLCKVRSQLQQLGFEHLTMEQGMSGKFVWDILIDRKGYVWATSWNGLNRFDGYHFTNYKFDPKDPHSINQDLILSLFEDSEGFIWVGTAEGGISRFDPTRGQFNNYKPVQPAHRIEPVLRSVSAMNEDRQGIFWVSSHSGELRWFNKKTGQFSATDYDLGYRAKPGDLRGFDRITCIYKDAQKDLWIGNRSGIHKLVVTAGAPGKPDDIRFLHYLHKQDDPNSLAGNEVYSIFEDHEGEFWVLTDSALNRMDKKTGRFVHYFHVSSDERSFDGSSWKGSIVEDQDGYIWISTKYGVDRLDKQRKTFEHFRHMEDDPKTIAGTPNQMAVDKAGNIWMGCMDGIDKMDIHQTRITWFKHSPNNKYSLGSNYVGNIYEDKMGILWFATAAGLDVLDNKTGRFSHYVHDPHKAFSLSDNLTSAVVEDDKGKLWISSGNGTLDQMDPKTGRFIHYIGEKGRYKNVERLYYTMLYIDSRGLLWIGTTSNGIISFSYKTNEFKHYGHNPADPDGISDYQTDGLCEDKEGEIWIIHGSVATDRLNPGTGKIKHYQYHIHDSTGISSNVINSIFKDSKGNLWFGTLGGGLCRYHDSTDTFTTYTEKDGLLDNFINSIVEDKEGNLWLGTGKGICRFSTTTETFANFDFLNSSKSNKERRFYCRSKEGVLYFDEGDGSLGAFDPGKITPNLYIPPIVITQFELFNEPIPGKNEAKEIELTYDQNFFSFEFAALNYTDAQSNKYAYKLDGVDKDWVFSNTRRTANYTSISPGTYTFHVKGSNNEGLWNNEGATMKIIIRPPWWKTGWAYALYTLFFLTGLYLMGRIQRKKGIEKERRLGRVRDLEMQALRAQMNPHFIFNCLSSINHFVLKNETEAASDYLTKFSRLIRTVLNNSKRPMIPLEDELDMLQLYLEMEKLRFKDAFSFCIHLDKEVDAASVFIPPLLFQPFIENSIWHGLMHRSEPGKLDVSLKIEKDILICIIEDNGVGRSYAQAIESKSVEKQKSMGIEITRQRLALINGKEGVLGNDFVIEDLYDPTGHAAGTKVILKIRYMEMTGEVV
jgi:ligand-binding sensor domain-containing protein